MFFAKTSVPAFEKRSIWYSVVAGLLFAIFVILPSIAISSFSLSTIVSKTLFFLYGLLIVLTISIYGILVSGRKTIFLRWSKVDIALLFIIIYILLNRFFFQPYYGFSIRFIELIGLSFLYIVLRRLSADIYPWLFLGVVLSGIAQAVYGGLQLFGYYPTLNSGFGITGSYLNPGPYAGFLASTWSVALMLFIFKDKLDANILFKRRKMTQFKQFLFTNVPLIGIISIVVIIPTTRSRAAWLSVLASTAIILMFKHKVWKRVKALSSIKKIGVVAAMAILLVAGFLGAYQFKKGSVDGRMLIWKVTTGILRENMVFGVGFDRFKAHYMNAQAHYFVQNGETSEALLADNSYHAFNEPLGFLVENGLVGFSLLVLLSLFILQLKTIRRHFFLKLGALAILLSISIFGLFSYPAQVLPIKLIGVLTLACLAGIDSDASLVFSPEIQDKMGKYGIRATKFAMILVCISLIFFTYTWSIKMGKAYKNWKSALNTYSYGAYENSTSLFNAAYPTLRKEGDFLMGYGKALAMAEQPKKAVNILQEAKKYLNNTIIETTLGDAKKELGKYREAEIAYQHAANMIPSRFYPHYLLVRLYDESGELNKAREKALEVMDKEVKIPSTAIEEMKREVKIILKKSPGI